MASQWYYRIGDRELGPCSPHDLAALAQAGRLKPTDFVRKGADGAWIAAGTVKGFNFNGETVIRTATSAPPPPPPVRPSVPPQQSAANPPFTQRKPDPPNTASRPVTSAGTNGSATAFWNPNAAANWSVLFTPIFGAYLVAKNWTTLGRPDMARRSMLWLWSSIGLWTLFAVLPFRGLGPLVWFLSLATLAGWYFSTAKPQNRQLLATYGTTFPRQSWVQPLLVGFGGLITYLVLSTAVAFVYAAAIDGVEKFDSDFEAENLYPITTSSQHLAAIGSLSDAQVAAVLNQSSAVDCVDCPIGDLLAYFQDLHNVPLLWDARGTQAAGVTWSTPVTISVRGKSYDATLTEALSKVNLRFVVRRGTIIVTNR